MKSSVSSIDCEEKEPLQPCENRNTKIDNNESNIPHLGVIFIVIASVGYSGIDVVEKILLEKISAAEIGVIRFTLLGLCSLPFVIQFRNSFETTTSNLLRIAIASSFKAVGTFLTCYSFLYLPVLDANVIINFKPVIVAVVSSLYLKESIGWFKVLNILLSMFGIILVCQPSFLFGSFGLSEPGRYVGVILALGAAFANSINNCLVRYSNEIHVAVVVLLQSLASLIIGLLIFGFSNETIVLPNDLRTIGLVIVLGFGNVITRFFDTRAMQIEDATPIAILTTLEIPVTFIFQWWILGTLPTVLGAVGTVITIAALVLTASERCLFKE
ncbi:Uncharacterised protein r2_g451 [Pycnogonum litorale]